jgi:hypothetical protein
MLGGETIERVAQIVGQTDHDLIIGNFTHVEPSFPLE